MKKQKNSIPPYYPSNWIYTDGSAYHKTKKGGWGVYAVFRDGKEEFYKGNEDNTTVSRMEMSALLKALKISSNIKSGDRLSIVSDSIFVVNSINKGWLFNWHRDQYFGRINADLWKEIYHHYKLLQDRGVVIRIHHINGHQKDMQHPHIFGNSVADILADYKQK